MRKTLKVLLSFLIIIAVSGCASLGDQRQAYVRSHPELDSATKSLILQGRAAVGMTSEQVIASMGKPYQVNRSGDSTGVSEQWVYVAGWNGSGFTYTYLYFHNGRLISWQEAPQNQ